MDEEKKPTPSDAGDENSRKGTPAPEPAAEEPSREESPPEEAVAAKGEAAEENEDGGPAQASPEEPAETEAKPAAAAKPQPSADRKAPPKRPSRPPRKKGPAYEDLEEDDLAEALKEYLGEDLLSAQAFLKQNIYTLKSDYGPYKTTHLYATF